MQDKNFDTLTQKFAKNIYGTTKGDIRAAVLWRDLAPAIAALGNRPLRILDAGGGFGFFSRKLAALGHDIVLCDISAQMLTEAQQHISASDQPLSIQLVHSPIQALTVEAYGQFDIILCHAVAEWLSDPQQTLTDLLTMLKPSGLFSLMFFNKEALRFHSLISGNFDYVAKDLKVKKKVGLNPTNPLYISEVRQWFASWELALICQSGVRVINDYLKAALPAGFDKNQLIDMELKYSQQEPYLSLGRYVHFIGKKQV